MTRFASRSLASLALALVLSVSPGSTARAAPSVSLLRCSSAEADAAYREEAVRIDGSGVSLAGRLFLPAGPGPHPAVVLLHGGGLKRLNTAPLFFAPLLARCGVAALVYDKRGTGASEGFWEAADFDDFVADAGAAVAFLRERPQVDAGRVGLMGFSQGGRLAPVVAARHAAVAFVVSVSAPFTPVAETRLYAVEQALRRRGFLGAVLDSTLALWKRHFAAVAGGDAVALAALDRQIRAAARRVPPAVLPPPSTRLPIIPVYNSMDRDYTPDLRRLRVPMLAVYGARDAVVPVQPSVEVLRRVLSGGNHSDVDVVVVPFADHSFNDHTFSQRIRIEETILNWIAARLGPSQPGHTGAAASR